MDDESRSPCLIVDWGNTLMRVFTGFQGPMARWPRVEAIPGVRKTLERLRTRYRVALATNAEDSAEADVWKALRRGGLDGVVDRVCCARNVGHRKPSPHFFTRVLAILRATEAEAISVGDDFEADVLGANTAGLRAVWFNERTSDRRQSPLCRTIHRFEDLPAALEGWSQPPGKGPGEQKAAAPSPTPGSTRL